MASEFPCMLFFTNPESGYDVTYETVLGTATFKPYALVVKDVSGGADDQKIDECGADPALILGVAMAAAVDANSPYPTGQVPVCRLNTTMLVGMAVAGTLAAANQDKAYGVVKSAAGNWKVDLSETAAAVFYIKRVDVTRQIAFGHFLASVLQSDAITDAPAAP